MRVALVINPGSGSVDDPDDIVALLRERGAEVRRFAPGEQDAAAASAADRVVVVGGDGTIAPVAKAAADAGLPLAIVPGGTANDFARALGIPLGLEDATDLAVAPGSAVRPVEVCLTADDRPFVNAANAGLAVRAAHDADGLKKLFGPFAYALGAVAAGVRAPAIDVDITLDGSSWFSGPAWQVIVSGTGRFGGGSAVGDTDQDDGLLDVTVVPAGPRLTLARRAYGLRRGSLRDQDAVSHQRARIARVHLQAGAAQRGFNIDGEIVPTAALDARIHPVRAQIVVPS
jgi:diacylglycerol kinase family enzyme